MSEIWDNLIQIQHNLVNIIETGPPCEREHNVTNLQLDRWSEQSWTSQSYRRARIDIIDARNQRGLWLMHFCIYPHIHNDGPIYGADIIAGKNKITGVFHDFSPTANALHKMNADFSTIVSKFGWNKPRELPDWAKNIFSSNMVAAGNITKTDEITQIYNMLAETTNYYISNISKYNGFCEDNIGKVCQNRYSYFQKQNPHTPKSMIAMGLSENDARSFVHNCLFPEI